MLESLAAFVAVSAVVICTPGQDTALTIRNTLSGGRRSGIATAGGVVLGQTVWTLAASAGVVALLSASEPAFRALKLAGAAYLVYLGSQSLYAALRRRSRMPEQRRAPAMTPRRALGQGALSNLGNPKMALFFASLLPQFAPGGRESFAGFLALGLLFGGDDTRVADLLRDRCAPATRGSRGTCPPCARRRHGDRPRRLRAPARRIRAVAVQEGLAERASFPGCRRSPGNTVLV